MTKINALLWVIGMDGRGQDLAEDVPVINSTIHGKFNSKDSHIKRKRRKII